LSSYKPLKSAELYSQQEKEEHHGVLRELVFVLNYLMAYVFVVYLSIQYNI